MVIQRKNIAVCEKDRLNFCEVEVFSCQPGEWGINLPDGATDCSRNCNCKPEETCSVATGLNSDCAGFPCSDGWWGENCERICHCAHACDRYTGYCDEAGCAEGYAGHQTCNIGFSFFCIH